MEPEIRFIDFASGSATAYRMQNEIKIEYTCLYITSRMSARATTHKYFHTLHTVFDDGGAFQTENTGASHYYADTICRYRRIGRGSSSTRTKGQYACAMPCTACSRLWAKVSQKRNVKSYVV